MGLRLPLDSLPWQAEAKSGSSLDGARPVRAAGAAVRTRLQPRPSTERPKTSANAAAEQWRPCERTSARSRPKFREDRTSLCVEPRDGRLYVFMPPLLTRLEDYLDLDRRGRALRPPTCGTPVLAGGVQAPVATTGSTGFSVTPDPGVIEVNVHPAGTLGRPRRHHARRACTTRPRLARLEHREVHARRPPHRHRRRQPHGARRRQLGRRQRRSSVGPDLLQEPGHVLEQPPVPVVPVQRACSSARRASTRGSTRPATTPCTSSRSPASSSPRPAVHRTPPAWLVDRSLPQHPAWRT